MHILRLCPLVKIFPFGCLGYQKRGYALQLLKFFLQVSPADFTFFNSRLSFLKNTGGAKGEFKTVLTIIAFIACRENGHCPIWLK